MEWLIRLLGLFKGSEAKTIIDGYKNLYESYKSEMLFWKSKYEDLEKQKTMPVEVKEHEQELLQKIIELTQKNWDLQEEIIFLKIIKSQSDKTGRK